MSVIKCRIRKPNNFTIIPNKVAQGLIYNPEALALYVYMFSLPESWEFIKTHLQKVSNLGRDKLEKTLNVLVAHGLLELVQKRDAQGKFAHLDFLVHDGSSFKIIDLNENAQPFPDLPLTADQSLVNSSYKRNKINKQRTKKETLKNYCSSGDERSLELFQIFWSLYPRKVGKKRAMAIWMRMKLNKVSEKINEDIKRRTADDPQWQEQQFVPYPSTYLNGERWEDEPHPKPIARPSSLYQPPKKQETPFSSVNNQSTSWISPEEALERDRKYQREMFKDDTNIPKGAANYANSTFEHR